MRSLLGTILQALVEAKATGYVGAGPYERTGARTMQRNGHRDKTVSTTAGDLLCRKDPRIGYRGSCWVGTACTRGAQGAGFQSREDAESSSRGTRAW